MMATMGLLYRWAQFKRRREQYLGEKSGGRDLSSRTHTVRILWKAAEEEVVLDLQ
tara:strand:- start:377 stop:541 length:165 start_codon:yes stop_codon:yes gene_type:complete